MIISGFHTNRLCLEVSALPEKNSPFKKESVGKNNVNAKEKLATWAHTQIEFLFSYIHMLSHTGDQNGQYIISDLLLQNLYTFFKQETISKFCAW